MQKFYSFIYRHILWGYGLALAMLTYHIILTDIPEHIYLSQGEELKVNASFPVTIGESLFGELFLESHRNHSATRQTIWDGGNTRTLTCYLCGVLPIKEVEVTSVPKEYRYAGGHIVGIYGSTPGVLVLSLSPVEETNGAYVEPAAHILNPGDYILSVNHEPVDDKEDLIRLIETYGDRELILDILRANEQISVVVHAVEGKSGDGCRYMLGIWVKDDIAGIGTITYYDREGSYGALGHGVGDGSGRLLQVDEGRIYDATIYDIVKGRKGAPGELQGTVHYGQNHRIGSLAANTELGIYGTLNEKRMKEYEKEDTLFPIGYKQEIKKDTAVILSDISGEVCAYHIRIESIDYEPADLNKGMRFVVDDEDLIMLTGGIVQGLSGSPIIQNGKLIGAVTHVLVNDPTQGYGVFVESMLGE